MKRQAATAQEGTAELYAFSKDKLPKTLSYPLKRSLLDAAMHSASVFSAVYAVQYSGRRWDDLVMDAFYNPEQEGLLSSGKVFIRLWAVPREQRQSCERILLAVGLPILCRWLRKSQTEGNVWRGVAHRLTLQITDSKLRYVEE